MATADGITIINFGMGSPTAATVMDLLSAINPKAVLFLGKCGGLKKRNKLGDLILPIAGIRGEGTSNDYFPPEVPAFPAFALQKAISTTIRDYEVITGPEQYTPPTAGYGSMMKNLKAYLQKIRAYAIDMETATIFSVGFYNNIPTGACCWSATSP